MPSSHDRLDALVDRLEQSGDDPFRLEVVRRAQKFKRSWIELATALSQLRDRRDYERWGYADLHEYCHKELSIRPSTVDKLLLSFGTVQRYAPEALESNTGSPRDVPSFEAVDYFTRAVGREEAAAPRRLDAQPEVMERLRSAVFEEGRSLPELRSEFGPLLKPKPEAPSGDENAKRARAAAERLVSLLPTLHEQGTITEARMGRVSAALEALLRDLASVAGDKAEDGDEPAGKKSRKRHEEEA